VRARDALRARSPLSLRAYCKQGNEEDGREPVAGES
jgi:hypothetical protein